MDELPTLQEYSNAVKLGTGHKLCHQTAADCRQKQHSLPSCISEAVKIEPCDEQQSNSESGLPADLLEVEKEEPFFMEEGLDSLNAEPVETAASPSVPQAPPANQELPTTADVFTSCQAALETARLASPPLKATPVHNCDASMTPPSSESTTSKVASESKEIQISSTDQEAGEACSPNNDRLPPTYAPSVNSNVLSYNGTKTVPATREASCKTKEAHNSVDFGRSKHLCIKLNECSVLLTRIHVSENCIYVCSEENKYEICSEQIAFPLPHSNHGNENLERAEMRCEKGDNIGGLNSSEENKLNSSKNPDGLQNLFLDSSKHPDAPIKDVISFTNSHGRRNKEKTHKCHVCSSAFRFKWILDQHINAVHLKLRPYKCSKCDYASSQVNHLKNHLNTVHAKLKQFKCSDCTYAATSKKALNNHMKSVHLKLKPNKCDLCSYAAGAKRDVVDHIAQVHLKLKRYKCQECDYAAAVKRNLALHVKAVHLKLKPFKCYECNSNFFSKSHLKVHISRVHLKSKPHVCPHCSYSASTKELIAKHVARVHLKLRPHKCLQCDFTCFSKYELDSHVKRVHLKLGPYKCQTCNCGFYNQKELEQHMIWCM